MESVPDASSDNGIITNAPQQSGQQEDNSDLSSILRQKCSGIISDLAALEELSVEHSLGVPYFCGAFSDCRRLFANLSDETPVALMGMGLDFQADAKLSPAAAWPTKAAIHWLETHGLDGCSVTGALSLENGSAYAAAMELLPFSLELRDRLAAPIVDGRSSAAQTSTSGAQRFPEKSEECFIRIRDEWMDMPFVMFQCRGWQCASMCTYV